MADASPARPVVATQPASVNDDRALQESQNWASRSHRELYESVHLDNDPGRVGELAQEWVQMSREICDSSQQMAQRLQATESGWQGEAADSARAAIRQLSDWSWTAGEAAGTFGGKLAEQGRVMEVAKTSMPEPVDTTDLNSRLAHAYVAGDLAAFGSLAVDAKAKNDQANSAHAQAVAVMAQMETDSQAVDGSTPPFVPPPDPIRGEEATMQAAGLRRAVRAEDASVPAGAGASVPGAPGTAGGTGQPGVTGAAAAGGPAGAGAPPLPAFEGTGGSAAPFSGGQAPAASGAQGVGAPPLQPFQGGTNPTPFHGGSNTNATPFQGGTSLPPFQGGSSNTGPTAFKPGSGGSYDYRSGPSSTTSQSFSPPPSTVGGSDDIVRNGRPLTTDGSGVFGANPVTPPGPGGKGRSGWSGTVPLMPGGGGAGGGFGGAGGTGSELSAGGRSSAGAVPGRVPGEGAVMGRGAGAAGQSMMGGPMGPMANRGREGEEDQSRSAKYVESEQLFDVPGVADAPPPVIGAGKPKKQQDNTGQER
ncbi:hypothetical protein MOQ72_00040 [Saccharopolyspora sp. K220]|uniref:WXG100 family type VII secretion target n=1 Tax=Saccharopolyspora soli TaxID=2926618 RepID=UPI001F578F86|nr:hypothetical protein [Saccharopolyspora soli]MCI2415798.1 hypothetical protein [Saccharopolyspora soli]